MTLLKTVNLPDNLSYLDSYTNEDVAVTIKGTLNSFKDVSENIERVLTDDSLMSKLNELVLNDEKEMYIRVLLHRLSTIYEYIESRKENMIPEHYDDLKYIIMNCDLESTW